MKPSIHPKYYPQAAITCSCGHILIVGSTRETMHTEICSNCHPFYTGKKKLVDIAGRVERFRARGEKSKALQVKLGVPKKEKKSKTKRSKE